jgi:hypothetical protein
MRWEFVLSPVFPRDLCVKEFVFALFEVSEINEEEIVIPDISRLVPVSVVCKIEFGSFLREYVSLLFLSGSVGLLDLSVVYCNQKN